MSDRFDKHISGIDDPYEDGAAVTPSDADDMPIASRALWIGSAPLGGGTLRVTTVRGTTLDLAGVPAGGEPLRLRVRRVHSTGTTVGSIVALY